MAAAKLALEQALAEAAERAAAREHVVTFREAALHRRRERAEAYANHASGVRDTAVRLLAHSLSRLRVTPRDPALELATFDEPRDEPARGGAARGGAARGGAACGGAACVHASESYGSPGKLGPAAEPPSSPSPLSPSSAAEARATATSLTLDAPVASGTFGAGWWSSSSQEMEPLGLPWAAELLGVLTIEDAAASLLRRTDAALTALRSDRDVARIDELLRFLRQVHEVAASNTQGCSLPTPRGCSLWCIGLQSLVHGVGCSLWVSCCPDCCGSVTSASSSSITRSPRSAARRPGRRAPPRRTAGGGPSR